MKHLSADQPDSDRESTRTQPHSDGYVERRMEEFRRLQEEISLDNIIFAYNEDKQYEIILKHPKGNEVICVEDLKGSAITGQILWARIGVDAPEFGSIQMLGIEETDIKFSSGGVTSEVCRVPESDNVILRNLSVGPLLITGPQRRREIAPGESIKIISGCWKLACGEDCVELMLRRPQQGCDGVEEGRCDSCTNKSSHPWLRRLLVGEGCASS